MIEQLEAHGPYVAFIGFMVILGLVLTVAAVADARHQKGSRS